MLYSKGFLDDISIPSIISLLAFTKTTGILRLENTAKNKVTTIYFKQGIATFANTNCQDLRLSSMLMKNNRLDLSTLRATEKYISPHKKHGQILMETGVLIEKELYETLKEQIKEIILSLFEWESGEFLFTQMDMEAQHFDIEFEFPMHHLLILGIMRINSFHRVMAMLGGPEMLYVKGPSIPRSFPPKLLQKYQVLLNCFSEPTSILDASNRMSEMKTMTFLRNILVLYSFGLIETVNLQKTETEQNGSADAIISTYSRILSQLCTQLADMSPVTMRLEIESALEYTKKQFPFIKQRIHLDDDCNIQPDFKRDLDVLPKPKQKEILLTLLHSFIESLMQNYKQQISREIYVQVVESMLQELMDVRF